IRATKLVEEVAEDRGQGKHAAATARVLRAAMTGQRERRRAERLLERSLPVAAHHERVIITQVVIDAHDRRAIVGLPVRRNRRHRKRNAVGANEITKARFRARLHAGALQRERISAGNRLQWIEPASYLKGGEVKQLVVDDRAADATAELM